MPREPTDPEIDAAILAEARPRSLKVARIILSAMDRLDPPGLPVELAADLPPGETYRDPLLLRFIERVKFLVAAGRLEAFGDVSSPRWSEVRLK